jgi:capsular exopolysaccharide synthesis family protein
MNDPTLQDYIAVLRRRRLVVIASVLLAVGVALALSLVQTPQYEAEAELLLRRTPSEDLLVDELGQARSSVDSERELNNEIRLIESRLVRDEVDARYNGPIDVDDVKAGAPASDTNDVLRISVVSADAGEAADLVNVYTDTYITVRQDRQIEDLLAASEDIQSRLDGLRQQIAELSKPLDEIEAQIAATPADSPERSVLEAQRDTIMSQVLPQISPLQSRESSFRSQLEQLEVTQDLTRAGGIDVLDPADEPDTPVSPKTVRNLVVGGLVGLLGGIALAFARDYADDSVRSKEDSERSTGLPTLALIPKVPRRKESRSALVTLDEPGAPAAEAFRSLRTSVKFLGVDERIRTVLVTSSAASEGKTITAANLAVALVQAGDRVLLIGADLRRPRLHELFGAPVAPGLTTVLLRDAHAGTVIYDVAELPGLHLLTSGPTPPNPSELLGGEHARTVFAELAENYDTVIIDSPPVLPVTDAQVLARVVDATLVVVAYGETSKRGLTRTLELLRQVDAPVAGTVLNLMPSNKAYAGTPYRYETYRSRSERRRQRQDRRREAAPAAKHRVGQTLEHDKTLAAGPNGDGGAKRQPAADRSGVSTALQTSDDRPEGPEPPGPWVNYGHDDTDDPAPEPDRTPPEDQ